MPSIIVVSGPNEGDYYPLKGRPMVVGRDEAAPIQLRDELVSRKHVRIAAEGADYVALDLKSANGTLVNGRRLEGDHGLALQDGDNIEVGNSKLVFSMQEFDDRESALTHWKQRGERGKSTLIR